MNELPDPQDETDRPGQEPTGTPEAEYYTPERVREFLAEDAMPPGLRARAAARMKQISHDH